MRGGIKIVSTITILLFAVALVAHAKDRVQKWEEPDIKDDFCGTHINFQYCKCAFHNDYCNSVGHDKGSASAYVESEYQKWANELKAQFGQGCTSLGGILEKGGTQCRNCQDGYVVQGDKCVEPEKADPGASDEENSCGVDDSFDQDWKKYSDFDDRIDPSSASYEVQQWHATLDKIAELTAEGMQLEYEMELDRQLRLEMREYKQALVQNIRSNITKAIIRLAWVTHNTIKGGKGWAGSYEKMFTGDKALERVGAGLKFLQSGVLPGSKAAIDTSDIPGKLKSTAWNATLETMEAVGDPVKVAEQAIKDTVGGAFAEGGVTGPDISEEEVAILRDQHLTNLALDELIADSYKVNAERRLRVKAIEKEIAEAYNEMQEWKGKEKTRVRALLEDECNNQ